MTKLRIAIVGLGMAVTPHAKSLLDLSDVIEVASVWSPSAQRRAAFAAAFPFPQADSLDALLADRTIGAVLILTAAQYASRDCDAMRRGRQACVAGKPVEITTARAEALVAACRKAGVTLGLVLQHRFRPAAEALAARIVSGELGPLAGCSTLVRLWRPRATTISPDAACWRATGEGC